VATPARRHGPADRLGVRRVTAGAGTATPAARAALAARASSNRDTPHALRPALSCGGTPAAV
jgi:hypothetical protein